MTEELKTSIQRAAEAIKAEGAREVFLFGSAASGQLDDGSDIDIAVSGLPPDRFFKAMGAAGDILGRSVDLVDLDDESPFTRYLKEEKELVRVA